MSISKHWQRLDGVSLLLSPLSLLFRILVVIRRALYQSGILSVNHSSLPTIVVGNVTVGGTGKTPFTIALVNHLKSQGYFPAVVSRGYGSKMANDGDVCTVTKNHSAEMIGDEPYLIAQKTSVPIAICKQRSRAVSQLEQNSNCDVVVSDDGLQHYAMHRDIEIVCIDAESDVGNGLLLPAGPLREPVSRLSSVDFVVSKERSPRSEDWFTLSGEYLISMSVGGGSQRLDSLSGRVVHAVAGIANPMGFFKRLETFGLSVVEHVFPDHHPYKKEDFSSMHGQTIVMTEKDAVKCAGIPLGNAWFLPVEPLFQSDILARITRKLERVIEQRVAVTR